MLCKKILLCFRSVLTQISLPPLCTLALHLYPPLCMVQCNTPNCYMSVGVVTILSWEPPTSVRYSSVYPPPLQQPGVTSGYWGTSQPIPEHAVNYKSLGFMWSIKREKTSWGWAGPSSAANWDLVVLWFHLLPYINLSEMTRHLVLLYLLSRPTFQFTPF